ncbi:MAG TPA: hypothetical protein ENI23_13910 [bacterium]|nr:hypothetical protein [bacterium]
MLVKKVRYAFQSLLRSLTGALREIGISWQYISLIIISLVTILYLSFSIYSVVKRGKENFDRIEQENERFLSLQKEGEALEDELEYTRSLEFKESFVRDSLNYARSNQDIYYIKREEEIEYEYLEKNKDPIVIDNSKEWWQVLVLGK